MLELRLQITLALLVLTCGPVLFWRRRDNILGYIQGGLAFSTLLVPLFGTHVLEEADRASVTLYANLLAIGAVAFLAGLCAGAPIGSHTRRSLPLIFGRTMPATDVPSVLVRRARSIGACAVLSLAAAFTLLGYVPALAADRLGAKYGVGAYRAGFLRGSLVYHVALAAASTVLPVLLAIVYRRRKRLDILLSVLLATGLVVSLSRGDAVIGLLIFGIALAVERRAPPTVILAGVCLVFVAGALANEILLPGSATERPSFSARVAAGAPDIHDHIGFLQGFRLDGKRYVGMRNLEAAMSVRRSDYDPATYAIRTLTGLPDVSDLASGGIRLPAPVWGYVSFGLAGAVLWSFIAGFFAGWGTTLVRRMLTTVRDGRGRALNMILAATFYTGTFKVLSGFYFPEKSGLIVGAIAVALGVSPTIRRQGRPQAEEEPAAAITAGKGTLLGAALGR